MRVLVCGGRNWKPDYTGPSMCKELDALYVQHKEHLVVIQGGAPGADFYAREWAQKMNVQCVTYKAEWNKHGKAAGPIRNQLMIDDGKPDLVIAFPGGKGTADMVRRAKDAGIEVREASDD